MFWIGFLVGNGRTIRRCLFQHATFYVVGSGGIRVTGQAFCGRHYLYDPTPDHYNTIEPLVFDASFDASENPTDACYRCRDRRLLEANAVTVH